MNISTKGGMTDTAVPPTSLYQRTQSSRVIAGIIDDHDRLVDVLHALDLHDYVSDTLAAMRSPVVDAHQRQMHELGMHKP